MDSGVKNSEGIYQFSCETVLWDFELYLMCVARLRLEEVVTATHIVQMLSRPPCCIYKALEALKLWFQHGPCLLNFKEIGSRLNILAPL